MERTLENLEAINEQLSIRNEELEKEKLERLNEYDALLAENEKLRLEAQAHAQEARTQRSIVHDIYQIVSGGKGEAGDWNGAEPVRKAFEALAADNAELRRQLATMRCA
ncbi:hypothetical protein [Vreelandella venusta]|uniref:hypothetical protein n=1 Tax=Vreelandella venusta TaxID=44935 RepID=UPI00200D59B0|nr:hypothetical protein [Halomonas venusta]UQI42707.1 hypothetical protein M3L73_10775 [Halomonas venusta]